MSNQNEYPYQNLPPQSAQGQPQQQQNVPPPVGIPFENNSNNSYPPMGTPITSYPQATQQSQPQYVSGQPIGTYNQAGYVQNGPNGYPQQQQTVQGYPTTMNNAINIPMMTNLNSCSHPTAFRCPYCSKEGVTMVNSQAGSGTYLMCCLLCCLGGVLGFIPFCVSECQDKHHFCPYCGAQVGTKEYKPC